jgi:hypothetical protein
MIAKADRQNTITNTWNNDGEAKVGQQVGQQNVYGSVNFHQ